MATPPPYRDPRNSSSPTTDVPEVHSQGEESTTSSPARPGTVLTVDRTDDGLRGQGACGGRGLRTSSGKAAGRSTPGGS